MNHAPNHYGRVGRAVVATLANGEKREYPSIRQAAIDMMENCNAGSINAASVAISHACEGKQSYKGHTYRCLSAYGRKWSWQ